MSGINRVAILGHLAADPERRQAGSASLVQFRVGVTEKWKRGNESGERTEWINVKCWGDGLCDLVMANLQKGAKVYIEGRFSTEKYNKNGEERYATYVVVQGFEGKLEFWSRGGDGGRRPEGGGQRQQAAQQRPAPPPQDDFLDDQIPF